jgi:hypothetical protein
MYFNLHGIYELLVIDRSVRASPDREIVPKTCRVRFIMRVNSISLDFLVRVDSSDVELSIFVAIF